MKTDAEIQKDVMDALRWNPLLNATEIGVAVHNGVVTLNGYPDTFAKKYAAEEATLKVKGVKALADELEVKLSNDDTSATDTEIAEKAVHNLQWNTSIPDEKVHVRVADGWVYLTGEVDWNFQKESAMDAVRYLKGVKGVSNTIIVRPKINTVIVKDKIRKALERSADVEASNIEVDTQGSKVILKGAVKTWLERRSVETAVWSAPGVAAIDDQLVVGLD